MKWKEAYEELEQLKQERVRIVERLEIQRSVR